MAIKMAFLENPFKKNGSVFPRQVQKSTMDFDKALELMRVGTAISENDMRSVFLHFENLLARYLPDGQQIKTPIGTFSLYMRQERSASSSSKSTLPADRKIALDTLGIRVRADRDFIAKMKQSINIQVVKAPDTQAPSIYSVVNTEKEGILNAGSAGDVLHLSGCMLSFLKSDSDQGVFFIHGEKGTEERASSYSRIGNKILNFKVPELSPGGYRLEVRTKPSENKIRVGIYASSFAVF
jgi:hypothetical protein